MNGAEKTCDAVTDYDLRKEARRQSLLCLPSFSHTDLQPAKVPLDPRSCIRCSLYSTAPKDIQWSERDNTIQHHRFLMRTPVQAVSAVLRMSRQTATFFCDSLQRFSGLGGLTVQG